MTAPVLPAARSWSGEGTCALPADPPCTAKRHGTRAAYIVDRCRCPEARAANTAYAAARDRRNLQAKYGAAAPLTVRASETRAVLAHLEAAGWTRRRIAAESGLRREQLSRVVGGTYRPVESVRWATHHALLRLLDQPTPVAPGSLVDATGTWRRLHALVANGWPKTVLAGRLGLGRALQLRTDRVTVRNADKVRALYEELWAVEGPSAAARAMAERNGWLRPLWWDDELIDDPAYDPTVGAQDEVPASRWRKQERIREVARLTALGRSGQQIADQLGVTPRQVVRDRAETARLTEEVLSA